MELARRTLLVLISLLASAQARIPAPEGTESLREFYKQATVVAHVRVTGFDEITHNEEHRFAAISRFEIQRAYKGDASVGSILRVPFTYFTEFDQGHDCVDFRKYDEWLIFVTYERGGWRLTHDCHAALPVSHVMNEVDGKLNGEVQLESDLLAGLSDNNPEERLWNLKRLAAWQPSGTSFETLHALINTRGEISDWALYACLRGEDWSVLPIVEQKLVPYEEPPRKPGLRTQIPPLTLLVVDLRYVQHPIAAPMLARLMTNAKWHLTRSAAAGALSEVTDDRALAPAAEALLDQDLYVRYSALVIVSKLTKASECSRPDDANDGGALNAASLRCRQWWLETGQAKFSAPR